MHMLFDWGGSLYVDVFNVFGQNSVFGSSIGYSTNSKCNYSFSATSQKNCLYDGPLYGGAGKPLGTKVWMLASTDGNGDGVMGIPMAAGGPFAGFNWNFSAYAPTAVPVPAAAWLFGSGLMGLVAAARRRKGA
jgi:hypothetical protein